MMRNDDGPIQKIVQDPMTYAASPLYSLEEGRPVLTRSQLLDLGNRILAMATAASTSVRLEHTARKVTRLSNGKVLLADDGDTLTLTILTNLSPVGAMAGASIETVTNQLNDDTLRMLVARAEAAAHDQTRGVDELYPIQPPVQDTYPAVALWHQATIDAMETARDTLLPAVLEQVAREGLLASGFVGFMARSSGYVSKEKITAYAEETDTELAITARTSDGNSVGWAGQTARDWDRITPATVAARAVDLCKRGVGARAVEPGRRTAILTAEAVAQLFRFFGSQYSADQTIRWQRTAFSKPPRSARYGEQMFDPRIRMSSDPADPEGGYRPWFGRGSANPAMVWAENGRLKELAYYPEFAVLRGRPYANDPYSIRVSGGETSLEQMIVRCQEGIFVNRFSSVDMVDSTTGMLTGTTSDGCFLIKDGKIKMPVKNFRILESPFFMLNKIVALGPSQRAAFGYTPHGSGEPPFEWPRLPLIVPPMMIEDFNFSSLIDAV
jgi:predicted Zn-dependent protease